MAIPRAASTLGGWDEGDPCAHLRASGRGEHREHRPARRRRRHRGGGSGVGDQAAAAPAAPRRKRSIPEPGTLLQLTRAPSAVPRPRHSDGHSPSGPSSSDARDSFPGPESSGMSASSYSGSSPATAAARTSPNGEHGNWSPPASPSRDVHQRRGHPRADQQRPPQSELARNRPRSRHRSDHADPRRHQTTDRQATACSLNSQSSNVPAILPRTKLW